MSVASVDFLSFATDQPDGQTDAHLCGIVLMTLWSAVGLSLRVFKQFNSNTDLPFIYTPILFAIYRFTINFYLLMMMKINVSHPLRREKLSQKCASLVV